MLALTLLTLIASAVAQNALVIQTPPSVTYCQPSALLFSGGTAPYILSVIPGGQPSAAPLENLPNQAAAGSYTWTVDIAAGTSVTISLKDATGVIAYSAPVLIQPNSGACTLLTSSAIPVTSASGTATTVPAATSAITIPITSASAAPVVPVTTAKTTSATTTAAIITSATTASTSAAPAATSTNSAGLTAFKLSYTVLGLVGAAAFALSA